MGIAVWPGTGFLPRPRGQFATRLGATFAFAGPDGAGPSRGGIGAGTFFAGRPGGHSQSKEPLGFVFVPRNHFAQLAADSTAAGGAGLHHRPRTDAPAGVESFAALLGPGGKGLPGLPARGRMAQAEFRPGRVLRNSPLRILDWESPPVARGRLKS